MTTIQKWGNSLAVRIPKDLAEKYQFRVGKQVELMPRDNGIILQTVRIKIPSLAELIRGVTKKNRHELSDLLKMKPVGKEIW